MPLFRIGAKNVLFIHIPKTGGTTVEAFLSRHGSMNLHSEGGKHIQPYPSSARGGALPFQHLHGELLESMFERGFVDYAFLIARNPLQRLLSEYFHSRRIGRLSTRLPFGAWTAVELAMAAKDPYRRSNHFRPQVDFQCFGAEVFKFEDGFESILGRLSDRLGLSSGSASIPHERKSQTGEVRISKSTAERVKSFYHQDYEKFGYS